MGMGYIEGIETGPWEEVGYLGGGRIVTCGGSVYFEVRWGDLGKGLR
jgi:hypothetical protein